MHYCGTSHNGHSEKWTTSVLRTTDNNNAPDGQKCRNRQKPHLLIDFGVTIQVISVVYLALYMYKSSSSYIKGAIYVYYNNLTSISNNMQPHVAFEKF